MSAELSFPPANVKLLSDSARRAAYQELIDRAQPFAIYRNQSLIGVVARFDLFYFGSLRAAEAWMSVNGGHIKETTVCNVWRVARWVSDGRNN